MWMAAEMTVREASHVVPCQFVDQQAYLRNLAEKVFKYRPRSTGNT
jgi:hypothetical protein